MAWRYSWQKYKKIWEPQTITNKKEKERFYYLCVSEDNVTFATYRPS